MSKQDYNFFKYIIAFSIRKSVSKLYKKKKTIKILHYILLLCNCLCTRYVVFVLIKTDSSKYNICCYEYCFLYGQLHYVDSQNMTQLFFSVYFPFNQNGASQSRRSDSLTLARVPFFYHTVQLCSRPIIVHCTTYSDKYLSFILYCTNIYAFCLVGVFF